jgi:hypothetical protein
MRELKPRSIPWGMPDDVFTYLYNMGDYVLMDRYIGNQINLPAQLSSTLKGVI